MGRSRYKIHDSQAPYFLTCTINNWIPVFTRQATVQVVIEALAYRQSQRDFKIYGYIWFPRAAWEPSPDAQASNKTA